MVTDKLIIIRVKSTGREFAYPASRYSELPTVSVEEGTPGHTNFARSELIFMEEHGLATRVGYAKLALNINYELNQADATLAARAISKATGE